MGHICQELQQKTISVSYKTIIIITFTSSSVWHFTIILAENLNKSFKLLAPLEVIQLAPADAIYI